MANILRWTWQMQCTTHGKCITTYMAIAVQQTWQLQYIFNWISSFPHQHSPMEAHCIKHGNCIFIKHGIYSWVNMSIAFQKKGRCISLNMATAFQHMCRQYNIFLAFFDIGICMPTCSNGSTAHKTWQLHFIQQGKCTRASMPKQNFHFNMATASE